MVCPWTVGVVRLVVLVVLDRVVGTFVLVLRLCTSSVSLHIVVSDRIPDFLHSIYHAFAMLLGGEESVTLTVCSPH
jgi:hypothetical protein